MSDMSGMATPITPAGMRIRQATQADRSFVAWCNYEATSPAPGFCYWDPLLAGTGTSAMAFLEAVFACHGLAWGHCEDFTLIEQDGQLIAGAVGFVIDRHDYRPLRLDRLPIVAAQLGWDRSTRAAFEQQYLEVWRDPQDATLAPSGAWTIECVAVAPAWRGRGVAKLLLSAILERGSFFGYTDAGIAVTVGNEAARRAYEALGFELYTSYGAAYFGGAFPGTIKYRRNLTMA